MRALLILLGLVVAAAVVQLVRPVPDIRLTVSAPQKFTVQGPALGIQWPQQGQAALGLEGVGTVGTAGKTAPQPIASVAKMMVAYLILKDHPLASGANGPSVTVTPADVTTYQQDLAGGQSVVPVVAGEVLNERQILEGLLLPSGNNLATLLGQWDAGSESAFVAKMNATAKTLGLTSTHYADASGVSPQTVSTAADQLQLAELDMQIATFRHIVAMPQATLPVAGVVYNVNAFLGRAGIVGIKTGSTSAAGGCFVAAAYVTAGGQNVLAIGSVLGQGGYYPLQSALLAGESLVQAASRFATTDTPVRKGEAVATLSAPWAAPVTITAPQGATLLGWNGLQGTVRLTGSPTLGRSLAAGSGVGTLQVTLGQQTVSMPLKASAAIPPPPLLWRLTRHGGVRIAGRPRG